MWNLKPSDGAGDKVNPCNLAVSQIVLFTILYEYIGIYSSNTKHKFLNNLYPFFIESSFITVKG
jgi:hypothetical protein